MLNVFRQGGYSGDLGAGQPGSIIAKVWMGLPSMRVELLEVFEKPSFFTLVDFQRLVQKLSHRSLFTPVLFSNNKGPKTLFRQSRPTSWRRPHRSRPSRTLNTSGSAPDCCNTRVQNDQEVADSKSKDSTEYHSSTLHRARLSFLCSRINTHTY